MTNNDNILCMYLLLLLIKELVMSGVRLTFYTIFIVLNTFNKVTKWLQKLASPVLNPCYCQLSKSNTFFKAIKTHRILIISLCTS